MEVSPLGGAISCRHVSLQSLGYEGVIDISVLMVSLLDPLDHKKIDDLD